MRTGRTLSWDWYPGTIPANVRIDESAYVETSFSFVLCRSEVPVGVQIGCGSATYSGTMFDVGPHGRVLIADYVLVNGVRFICDAEVEIGDYTFLSWNVVLMDTYRVTLDPFSRRRELERAAGRHPRRIDAQVPAQPIRIGRAAWLGFDVCVLPGVTIGEGAIVGARSVVASDVPPYTVVAGNPARVVRRLSTEEINYGR